jgi:hypothetical protein
MACCSALVYVIGLIVRPLRRRFALKDRDAPQCQAPQAAAV